MQITVKQLKQLIREAVEEAYNEGEMEEETVEECGYEMSAEKEDGGPLRRGRGRGDMEQDERFLEEYLAEAKKAKKAKEDKKPAKKLPAFIVKAQEKAAAQKKAAAEAAKKKPVAKK